MARAKKRADGRYCSQIYLGRDENGKRKYKSVYAKTPAELKEKETSVRLQLGQGLDVLSQRDSFATWADDWLRLKEKEQITCRQMDNYRRAVKLWKEELPGYEIGQVRADDVERVLIALSDQGLAQRTVDLYRSAMRQIMRRAVGRVIPTNPVEQVELAAVGRKAEQRRALTAEEQQWIWNTPHRAQPVAVIMMLSGLRRGELAALTWNDVDLKARTITVNKTIEYDSNGTPTLRHVTKSDAGMRTVDIPQRLADYMAAMPRDGLLVIHSAKGEVMTATAWAKLWRSYMRELNIKYGTRTPADLERMRSGKPGPKVFDMSAILKRSRVPTADEIRGAGKRIELAGDFDGLFALLAVDEVVAAFLLDAVGVVTHITPPRAQDACDTGATREWSHKQLRSQQL